MLWNIHNDANRLPVRSGDVHGKTVSPERLIVEPVQTSQMLNDENVMVDHILIDLIMPFTSGKTGRINTNDANSSFNQKIQQIVRQLMSI